MELIGGAGRFFACMVTLFAAAGQAWALEGATATSTGWWKDDGPHLAIDGEWRTLYVGTGEGNTVEVAFEAPRVVESIAIGFHAQSYHRPRGYRLELGLPDGSWVPAAESTKIPPEVAHHVIGTPTTATGLRIIAAQLSASKDVGIREVFINQQPWVSTTSLDLPRPALRHNTAVRVQPFDARLKFYHHGDGLLFYTHGKFNRVDAVLVVSPLAADAGWFGATYGMGRHAFSAPFTVNEELVAVELDGPAGRHRLAVEQQADAVTLRDTFVRTAGGGSDIRAAGLVFRLPVDFWAGGRWTIGDHSGELAPVAKATGDLATPDDMTVLPLDGAGDRVQVELRPQGGRGAITLEIDAAQLAELRYVRRSGFTGHFIDLYAIPREGGGGAGGPASFDWQWDVRFDESLPREWWDSFRHASREDAERLADTDASAVASKAAGSSGHAKGQILDPQSPYYGAVPDTTGDRNGLIEAMPLHTRNHVIQLARRYRETGNTADLPAIMAGLDYLSATVAPWGQFGDIRVGGWVEAPFFWDIVGVAEAIEVVRPDAETERVAFWLAALHRQYQAVADGTRHRLRFKDDIGPNMVTFAVQLFRMARYFRDDAGGDLARDAMSFALAINPSPFGGLQRDYSYSHGNQFDTGYYRWLLDQSFGWHNLTKGTSWELAGEDRAHWEGMQEAFHWLLDNGQLNTMAAHPKNRLIEPDLRSLKMHGPEALWGPAVARAERARAQGNDVLATLVVDDRALPIGHRFFDVAGMLVDRTAERYLSFWWNARAKVRDDASGPNANYNAKVPVGSFYLRPRAHHRELTIPSDNIHHSGAVLAEGMESLEDWATGFENYAGSRLSGHLRLGDTHVFVGDIRARSKGQRQPAARFTMTTVVTPTELVRVMSGPAQPKMNPLIVQPLVVRAMSEQTPSIDGVEWLSLAGEIAYDWSLSDEDVDGSQRYATMPAARAWRLRGRWTGVEPLATAWQVAAVRASAAWTIEELTPVVQRLRSPDGTCLIVLTSAAPLRRMLRDFPEAHIVVGETPGEVEGRAVEASGEFWLIRPPGGA